MAYRIEAIAMTLTYLEDHFLLQAFSNFSTIYAVIVCLQFSLDL